MACDNTTFCTCTFTSCSHHGKCCECIAYHKANGEVPGCLFSKAAERTGNRTIENLYNDTKKTSQRF